MQPFKRQTFICSAIEKCQEKVNCCAHKTPHIKDERCVPRECRYALDAGKIDCDPFDPENPRAPVPIPTVPVKTVEQVLKEKYVIAEPVKEEPVVAPVEEVTFILEDEVTQEINIKEAVKKQATSKKKGRK
jgi:hypothetical protein